jgi:hypothetical protein
MFQQPVVSAMAGIASDPGFSAGKAKVLARKDRKKHQKKHQKKHPGKSTGVKTGQHESEFTGQHKSGFVAQ